MIPYRVAIYIRLSMEDRDQNPLLEKQESNSVSNQRSYIQNYLHQRTEFQNALVQEFVDDGYSGTNFDRPAVKEMLTLCRQGQFDCIVVKDLSRFGRNYLEVGEYLEQIFPLLGIRLIGINDGFDSEEYSGQTGGMDVAFRNFIYEMYSRDLSEKVKSGVQTCMSRGEYYSGWIVYGYQKTVDGKTLCIDETAAIVVRRIFQEMADGKSAEQIAIELNAESVPTRLVYKQAKGEQRNRHYKASIWNRDKIYAIVHNEIYQGDMIYRKAIRPLMGNNNKKKQPKEKWIQIKNHHHAIVSRELFQQANDMIRKRETAEYNREGVMRGIVFCGCCGNRLELHQTKNAYYLCKRRKLLENVACNSLRIDKAFLEALIWNMWQVFSKVFQTEDVRKMIAKKLRKMRGKQREFEVQMEQIPAGMIKLYEAFRKGEIEEAVFIQEKERLSRNRKEAQQGWEQISQQMECYKLDMKGCESLADLVRKDFHKEKRMEAFLRKMVKKVIVYEENRIEIVWWFRDEFEGSFCGD